jgi:hypothetical protein
VNSPPEREMNKTKYIYILSQRYSGSTLLSFLLGTHPEISTIGERRKFYNKVIRFDDFKAKKCSCGQHFTKCDYLNDIKTSVLKRISKKELSTNATFFQHLNNKKLNQVARIAFQFYRTNQIPMSLWPFAKKTKSMCFFNRVLVEEILKKDGTTAFLDSSKVIDQTLYLSLIPDFDFYVVWLTRDPRAQVNSALKYNKWTTEKAVLEWKREMDLNKKILDKLDLNYTTLRYEALCANPDKELTRLFDFVDLDASQYSLDFRKPEQHIIGNGGMRLGKDTKIVERKDWKNSLTAEQIGTIESLTKSYRAYYSE